MTKLLFGTDPEGFAVYKKERKLYCLPPYFFRKHLGVKASKDEKHPVFFSGDGFKFHEDGAAFEMSVRPSHDPMELFDRIQECARIAGERIFSAFPEYCLPELQFLPAVGFDVERWKNEGEEFKMATEFGCDPDRDVFDIEYESESFDASLFPQRFGGGHIHFSGSKLIERDPILAVKVLAITAGCAAVLYSDSPKLEKQRTFRYGKPGKFRVQNYGETSFGSQYSMGIEYRTISCRWASNRDMAKEIFYWGEIAITEILPRPNVESIVSEVQNSAIDAILRSDKNMAKDVLTYIQGIL